MDPNNPAEELFKPLGDLLGDVAPTDDEQEGDEGEAPDPVAELRAELERERQARQDSEAQYRQMMTQLMSQRPAAPPPAEPEQVSFDGLPDPVEKPAEYTRALAERMERLVDQRVTQRTSSLSAENDQQATANALQQKLAQRHADIAGRELLVSAAAQAEAAALRAQGVDPLMAAKADPDSFVDRIASRVKRELGIEGTGTSQNRTKGVSSGSAPSGAPKPAGPKPKSFVEQLKDHKSRMGLL